MIRILLRPHWLQWWLFSLLLLANAGNAAELQVGAAAATINPAPDSFMAGYDRDRRVEGVHDDVFVKAVVVAAGDEAVAFVVVDTIGLLYPDVQRIRQRAVQLLGGQLLIAEHIIVTSTHTHAGPDVAGLWGEHLWSSGRDEAYIDLLVSTAAEQIATAAMSLQPALMKVGSATANLSRVENLSEPGLLDNRFTAIAFTALDGLSIATLTNFPCHPTVLGPDNQLVSSDYVGGFYREMDRVYGGVNLFLQGAIGGWVQPRQGDRSFTLATEFGELLASISVEVLTLAQPVANPELQFASTSLDIPLENWGFRLMLWLGVLDRELIAGSMRTEVAWFALGDVQFATHPGETSPAYSLQTRELMGRPRHSMVLGLGLDALGYILKPEFFTSPEDFPHADYLTTVSVGPEAAPLLMKALASIIPAAADSASTPAGAAGALH